jgi:hypothetical protein
VSSYANIPNIKEQTGWRVSFWFAVSSPLVDVPLGFLAAALGTYQGMTEQIVMSRTPGAFRTVLAPRGSSKPEWLSLRK